MQRVEEIVILAAGNELAKHDVAIWREGIFFDESNLIFRDKSGEREDEQGKQQSEFHGIEKFSVFSSGAARSHCLGAQRGRNGEVAKEMSRDYRNDGRIVANLNNECRNKCRRGARTNPAN